MKILITDKISKRGIEQLENEPGFEVDVKPDLTPAQLLALIGGYDALIIRSATKVTAEVIERAQSLKVIGRAGTGVDNVNVEAATRKGIAVMNTPGGNSTSVAEHTMALMLSLARSIPKATASLKQGQWDKKSFLGVELRDKTLGLIGLGKIGSEVARRARAFQMKVLAYDPFVSERVARDLNVALVPLEKLLPESDFISLHLAFTPETRHFINRDRLRLLKPTARLINCARGELLDEAALYKALTEKKIAGAALDVFNEEPPMNRLLLELPNVIATPHLGASTIEAQESVGFEIAEQVRTFLKNGVVQNAVNVPSMSLEEYRRLEPFLHLGGRLGTFLATLAEGRLNEVSIRYYGELPALKTQPITQAILRSLLAPVSDRVNAINARAVAQERHIAIVESQSTRPRQFSNLISIKLHLSPGAGCPEREEWAEGAVLLGSNEVLNPSAFRLVSVDGIDIDAPLRGTMLFFRNQDTPGVIGHVGTTLGRTHINIASFTLGRDENTHTAVGLVNIDDDVPPAVLSELQKLPAVKFAKIVRL